MRFPPADFWIGESGIGFFSLMWEHGKSKNPVEFLDDRGIVKSPLDGNCRLLAGLANYLSMGAPAASPGGI
jgi:hypothetical protein